MKSHIANVTFGLFATIAFLFILSGMSVFSSVALQMAPQMNMRPLILTTIDSENFAGYAIDSSLGSVSMVNGSWKVPTVSCLGVSGVESIEIITALDGYNASLTAPRNGFRAESTCESGTAYYTVSYFEAGTSTSFYDTKPEDILLMQINYYGGDFHMSFSDLTQKYTRTFLFADNSAPRDTGEWLLGLVRSPLLDFAYAYSGPYYSGVSETDMATVSGATGSIGYFASSSSVGVFQQNMVDSNGFLMASTSSLVGGASFYVRWVAAS